MKYLGKQILMILIGLSVMLLAVNGTAADVNSSQASTKQALSDFLPKTSGQNVADSLVLAQLGSVNVAEPVAAACSADNQCLNANGQPSAIYKCCVSTQQCVIFATRCPDI